MPEDQVLLERRFAVLNSLVGGPGGKAYHQGTVELEAFYQSLVALSRAQLPESLGLAPSGFTVRDIHTHRGIYVFLVEQQPGPRLLKWISPTSKADFGDETTYCDVNVSLPWQYFFVAMTASGGHCGNNSVYFRSSPLQSLDDELCEPHFLNCSVNAYGVSCWICQQGFSWLMPDQPMLAKVAHFVDQFYFTGFNRSSEKHEGNSFFGKNCQCIPDARVQTVGAWQQATQINPTFPLSVPWVRAGLSPRNIYDQLTQQGKSWQPTTASDFGKVITNIRGRK